MYRPTYLADRVAVVGAAIEPPTVENVAAHTTEDLLNIARPPLHRNFRRPTAVIIAPEPVVRVVLGAPKIVGAVHPHNQAHLWKEVASRPPIHPSTTNRRVCVWQQKTPTHTHPYTHPTRTQTGRRNECDRQRGNKRWYTRGLTPTVLEIINCDQPFWRSALFHSVGRTRLVEKGPNHACLW